jgi:hypothetical protein
MDAIGVVEPIVKGEPIGKRRDCRNIAGSHQCGDQVGVRRRGEP